jgi:dienelactone hydrolase
MMRRWPKRLLIVLVITVAACAAWWVWYSKRDYGAVFLQRKGQLLKSDRTASVSTSKTTVYDLKLISTSGLVADARMRVPNRQGKFPCVLLAAGLETGKRVIDLVEERDDMVMLAVDYGWRGEFDISTLPRFCRAMETMRGVAADAVPRMLLALEFLAQQPDVDPQRLVVVGVSYGSYLALPAAALDAKVSRLVLVQGGGEMGAVIAANTRRWQAPFSPRMTGWIGKIVLLPYQPERWIRRIAPRPVTFIASRTDPEFPVAAVEAVFAQAAQPKELVWHDTVHVAPDAAAIIAELGRVVIGQLGTTYPPR